MQHEIKSSLVSLRPLRREFIGAYLEHFSPAIRAALHVTSLDAERAYLAARLAHTESVHAKQGVTRQKNSFFYCIFDTATTMLIGAIEIRSRDESAGQLYCWMHEEYWGKGHFQEALQRAVHEYFAQTGEKFFTAHVDVENMRSYGALKKAGFAPWGFHDGPHGKQHVLLLRNRRGLE